MAEEKKQITEEYKQFWSTAEELGKRDVEQYPLGKRETLRVRVEKHLVGMLEMYRVRYEGNGMDYVAMWKALKVAVVQKSSWNATELVDLLTFIELEYAMKGVPIEELTKAVKE